MNNALEQKVTFTIDSTKFKRSINMPYKKYKFVVKESNEKVILIITSLVTIVAGKVIPFQYATLWYNWFLKMYFNGFLSSTMFPLTINDPMKIGYQSLLFDLVGLMSWLLVENVVFWQWMLKAFEGWHFPIHWLNSKEEGLCDLLRH